MGIIQMAVLFQSRVRRFMAEALTEYVRVFAHLPLLFAVPVNADLTPLSDDGLRNITGAGAFAIERYSVPANVSGTDYTRLTFNGEIETVLSMDTLEVGRYERAAYSGERDRSFRGS